MTPGDRYNEAIKARSTFLNALAIGTIIAGGLSAVADARFLVAIAFGLVGLMLHYMAVKALESLKVDADE